MDASSPKMSNPGRHACPKAAVRTQGMTVIVALDVSDGELVKLGKESKTRCIQVACKRRRMIVDALETTM